MWKNLHIFILLTLVISHHHTSLNINDALIEFRTPKGVSIPEDRVMELIKEFKHCFCFSLVITIGQRDMIVAYHQVICF